MIGKEFKNFILIDQFIIYYFRGRHILKLLEKSEKMAYLKTKSD